MGTPAKRQQIGFTAIVYPDGLVPCAADPEPFDRAQMILEKRGWLGNLRAVEAICDYCIDCPITEQCADAAAVERYSGIAGGRVWKNGQDKTRRVKA